MEIFSINSSFLFHFEKYIKSAANNLSKNIFGCQYSENKCNIKIIDPRDKDNKSIKNWNFL